MNSEGLSLLRVLAELNEVGSGELLISRIYEGDSDCYSLSSFVYRDEPFLVVLGSHQSNIITDNFFLKNYFRGYGLREISTLTEGYQHILPISSSDSPGDYLPCLVVPVPRWNDEEFLFHLDEYVSFIKSQDFIYRLSDS